MSINGTTRPTTRYKPRLVNYYYLGYQDFKMGLAYYENEDYHTWAELDQKNYEMGRLAALENKPLSDKFMKHVPKNTIKKVNRQLIIASIEL